MSGYPIAPPPEAKRPPTITVPFDPNEDDGRCQGTSWRSPAPRNVTKYEQVYGPAGYNRCIYTTEEHYQHRDEWGNVFVLDPKFRVVRREA